MKRAGRLKKTPGEWVKLILSSVVVAAAITGICAIKVAKIKTGSDSDPTTVTEAVVITSTTVATTTEAKTSATQPVNPKATLERAQKYKELVDYKKALELYLQAADEYEQEAGHPDTSERAWVLHDAGAVCYVLKQYDNAIKYYREALEIIVVKLGKEDIFTATLYYNTALAFSARENHEEALRFSLLCYRIELREDEDSAGAENTLNQLRWNYERSGYSEPFDDWLAAQLTLP